MIITDEFQVLAVVTYGNGFPSLTKTVTLFTLSERKNENKVKSIRLRISRDLIEELGFPDRSQAYIRLSISNSALMVQKATKGTPHARKLAKDGSVTISELRALFRTDQLERFQCDAEAEPGNNVIATLPEEIQLRIAAMNRKQKKAPSSQSPQ